MTFPDKPTEIAYLEDLNQHYAAETEKLMKQTHFKKEHIDRTQAISALAESAKEVAEILKAGGY